MGTKKPMNKWLLYTIFVAKFVSGLGLIIWTVYMTMQAGVGKDDDNSFLSTYHNIDNNYNDIVLSNARLNSKYYIEFKFNDEVIKGITHEDVFLAQRAISQRKIRKNILKPGTNNFEVKITDKDGNCIKNVKTNMLVTMATTHENDKRLEFKNGKSDSFELKQIGYWNITGTIEIGKEKGFFFIKTNAK